MKPLNGIALNVTHPELLENAGIIEHYITHYTVHPEVSKGETLYQPQASIPQPERNGCRELCNAQ